MNKERIANVIRALRETPHKDRFSMDAWAHPCGTPACAIGNYAVRPDLQDAFRLESNDYGTVSLIDADTGYVAYLEDEIADHFDITENEADVLFGSQGCGSAKTTEQAVAYLEWYLTKPEFT